MGILAAVIYIYLYIYISYCSGTNTAHFAPGEVAASLYQAVTAQQTQSDRSSLIGKQGNVSADITEH